MTNTVLNGCRVLVVEDEALIGLVLEDILETLGCVIVANAATLAEAAPTVETGAFDVGILDVHVSGEAVYPLADALVALGKPIVFATGATADSLPERFRGAIVLEKPYTFAMVENVLTRAVATAAA